MSDTVRRTRRGVRGSGNPKEINMASETPDRPYSSIALIDLSAVFAQYWFGNLNKAGENAPKLAVSDTMLAIERIDRSVRHTVLCLDAPPYLRATVYPEYKAHRPPAPPELISAKREVLRLCEEKGYRLAKADGFEGDDIVATLASVYGLICDDVRIIGCDKDLFQLVNQHVRVLRPAKGDKPEVLFDGPAIFKHTGGVTPAMIVDWLALMGDAGDNIPGCPSVGDKRATAILGQYGSLDKLYWELEHKPVETNRVIGKSICAKLIEFKAQVFQARELVRLRIDAPVDANELLFKGKAKPVVAKAVTPLPDDDQDDDFDAAVRRMPESSWPNPSGKPEEKLLDPAVAIPGGSPAAANAEMADEAAAALPKGPGVAKAKPRLEVVDTTGAPANEATKEAEPTLPEPPAEPTKLAGIVPARGDDQWDLALEPRTMKQAIWLANEFAARELFPALGGWQGYLAVIMMGRELGLGAMASLTNITIVEGRPSPNWQIIVGFVQQHPDCEYFMLVSSSRTSATYKTKRRQNPEATELTYTIEDAQIAGLVKPFSGWDRHPAAMCRKMCATHLARAVYPDSKVVGLYAPEEMGAEERAA